jgi:hypothetical protein
MPVMQKCFFALFLSLCLVVNAQAQQYTPFEQIRRFTATQTPGKEDSSIHYLTNSLKEGIHYLYPLYQAIGWEEKFKKEEGDKNFYEDFSQLLSFTGDMKMADYYGMKSYDTLQQDARIFIQQQVDQLRDLQSINAASYISGIALDAQVVMINEAHNKPVHRAFTYSLLEQLYKEGFRYLAMEMLSNYANHSLKRLDDKTGFYAKEPVAGEMIRKAISLGYTLVSYEDTIAYKHTPSQRDSSQAAHIYEVIKQDPKAKILVHAGYGHISEAASTQEYIPMGLAFKKLSGIDPLTIDQTVFTEGSNFEYGRLYYDALMQKIHVDEPVVLLKNRNPYPLIDVKGYDLYVVHPPSVYKNNRPSWLSLNGERKETTISPQEKTLFFVQAYYEDEYNRQPLAELVPADQTYITSDYGYYSLYLKPGKYKLVFRDIGYKKLNDRDREVK